MPYISSIARLLLCSSILLGLAFATPGASAGPSPTEASTLSPATPAECSDDLDNEGDGFIDFDGGPYGEAVDPGCAELTDDSEDPFNDASIADEREREISIRRVHHKTGSLDRFMVVRGTLETFGDATQCSAGVWIRLERRSGGTWKYIANGPTHLVDHNEDNKYPYVLTAEDEQGRYRVSVPQTTEVSDEEDHYNVCLSAAAKINHEHRH